MDETALPRTPPGDDSPAEVLLAVDPLQDTGPQPAAIGPFPADHHTHAQHGHPHVAMDAAAVAPRHAAPRRLGVGAVLASAVVVVMAAGGVTAYALSRPADQPTATPDGGTGSTTEIGPGAAGGAGTTSASASTVPMLPASQPTLVLGDSLALTVYPWLADLLPDRYVSYQAEVGRSTAWAARALEKLDSIPPVVIVSIGTNDASAADVESGARTILVRLGPKRCVVWVDVVRPDRVGDPQDDINAALARAGSGRSNVSILHWTDAVATHPGWLSGDGIHTTELGAQARAEAFAAASKGCSPFDAAAPRARRQLLPSSAFSGPLQGHGGTRPPSGSGTSGPSSPTTSGSTRSSSPSATSSGAAPGSSPSTPAPSTPASSTPASSTPAPSTPTAEPPSGSASAPPSSVAPDPPASSPAADPTAIFG